MKPDLKDYIQKLGKLGKDRFILLFLAGILLVVIAMPIPQDKQSSKQWTTKNQTATDQTAGENGTDNHAVWGISAKTTGNILKQCGRGRKGKGLSDHANV